MNQSRPTRALVVGGAGFVGAALAERLLTNGFERVTVLDSFVGRGSDARVRRISQNAGSAFRMLVIRADVTDQRAIVNAISASQPEVVFHTAGISTDDQGSFVDAVRTNVLGISTLLTALTDYWRVLSAGDRDQFRFVRVSRASVFGALPGGAYATEQFPRRPRSPLTASLAAADSLTETWLLTYGLPTVVVTAGTPYGPWQAPDRFIPRVIQTAMSGHPIRVEAIGSPVRDWLFIDDLVEGLALVAARSVPGQAYLLGGMAASSDLATVTGVCALLDQLAPSSPYHPHRNLIERGRAQAASATRQTLDPTATMRRLKWSPRETLGSGLRQTIDWFLAHSDFAGELIATPGTPPLTTDPTVPRLFPSVAT